MSPAKALNFASQFKIAAYHRIIKNAEAVDDSARLADRFHNAVGVKVEVLVVPDRNDQCIDTFEGLIQIVGN